MLSRVIAGCVFLSLLSAFAGATQEQPAASGSSVGAAGDARDGGTAVMARLWIVAFDESIPASQLPVRSEELAQLGRAPSEKGRIPTWGLALQESLSEFEVRCQEHTLRVQDGRLVIVPPDSSQANAAPFEIVSAPQLLVLLGQEAAIQVGRPVAHLEKSDDDCLRVVTSPEHVEGASIRLTPTQVRTDGVRFERIRVSVTRVERRLPIDGVPLDVGRPVLDTRETYLDLTLPHDKIALIPLPGRAGEPALVAFLMASVVKP